MKNKTLQEQIDKFYNETGYRLEVKNGRPYYCGSLALRYSNVTELPDNLVVDGLLSLYGSNITKLPDNLVVGGWLNLQYTKITKIPDNLVVGGGLELAWSNVSELPDNLVVGGGLGLSHTKITKIPENLVVGGCLDLEHSNVTELPENFVVVSSLYLEHSKVTELPENLVVGGSLYLGYTEITELPENLVVGGSIDIYNTKITELPKNLNIGCYVYGTIDTPITPLLSEDIKEKLQNIKIFQRWEQNGKTYIKADGIFSIVDNHKGNVWITHQIGKEETLYVVTDGEGHYAHGNTLKEAKADLIYKINDRDTSLYENLTLNDELSFVEAIAMYRTITGACSAGTKDFVESRLPQPHKEKYTIKEIIDLTDGEYGNGMLKEFFKIRNC